MPRTKGIIGTTSPFILVASVYHDGGAGGIVFVGQSIITALLAIKGNIADTEKHRWNIGVWDTRVGRRQEPMGEVGNEGPPTMQDGVTLEEKIEELLRNWG